MEPKIAKAITVSFLILILGCGLAQAEKQAPRGEDWTAEEYSGSRTKQDLRAALSSKGFAWLSGSPADNEKLSIGKNAQFFGFVALRYQSGRSANRGALGRAFFEIADSEQRKLIPKAVLAEERALEDWWTTRATLLRLYEDHLYTGKPIDEKRARQAGAEHSELGAVVAIHEARAFAKLERSLREEQRAQIMAWRENPEKAREIGGTGRVNSEVLEKDQLKQLEDLYAKAFSWLTGTPKDNEIIPLGQPAQFFGFVAIRHKSGHAASRGKIAKSFREILTREQLAAIDLAIAEQLPVVEKFLQHRHSFLEELALLRSEPEAFEEARALKLAVKMGELEAEAGWIEAQAYRTVRASMSEDQILEMMALRSDYIVDPSQMELLTHQERGAQLAILCAGCHGAPGQHRPEMVGPTLDGLFDRPIATAENYEYSDVLKNYAKGEPWTAERLDEFLAAPKTFAPGTKMEFQGLLNATDRRALIDHLQETF
ncbi:MAG: c-type cytochrome [Verrucomicrobiota bacterium]